MTSPQKTPSAAAIRFLEQRKKQKEALRTQVAQARAESGKEPFDFQAFAALYDVRQDYDNAAITPELIENYEEEYYLRARHVQTLREFVEYKEELRLHDAT